MLVDSEADLPCSRPAPGQFTAQREAEGASYRMGASLLSGSHPIEEDAPFSE